MTDTWEQSPAKRAMVDTVHHALDQLKQAEQRLQELERRVNRVRRICEFNECDALAPRILDCLDGHQVPLAAPVSVAGRRD